MDEQWKDIVGFEGYQISDWGNVRNKKGKILSLITDERHGHIRQKVSLTSDKKRRKCFIARLVALHFVENPENKPEVDHKDQNSLNNKATNLRWATRLENSRNRGSHKGSSSQYKGVHKSNKKWQATIKMPEKALVIGRFDCEHAAAHAYNEKAKEFFGPDAVVNIIKSA